MRKNPITGQLGTPLKAMINDHSHDGGDDCGHKYENYDEKEGNDDDDDDMWTK